MEKFQAWALLICGIVFKVAKDRRAARRQKFLGFWWNSRCLSRSLEDAKLANYLKVLEETALKSALSLKELQQLAGKMHRAVMTLPPGAACLLHGIFTAMAGLKLPWHKRRISRDFKEDLRLIHSLLRRNMGKGYYSYAGFREGPGIRTDASKSESYTGGGFISQCGRFDFWVYGKSASRKPIDFLEGDTVREACIKMGPLWKGCRIHIEIDNSAFELSLVKGRSRAARLNEILVDTFVLQLMYGFVLEPSWIASADNTLADILSRWAPLGTGNRMRYLFQIAYSDLRDFLWETARWDRAHGVMGVGTPVAAELLGVSSLAPFCGAGRDRHLPHGQEYFPKSRSKGWGEPWKQLPWTCG